MRELGLECILGNANYKLKKNKYETLCALSPEYICPYRSEHKGPVKTYSAKDGERERVLPYCMFETYHKKMFGE